MVVEIKSISVVTDVSYDWVRGPKDVFEFRQRRADGLVPIFGVIAWPNINRDFILA